MEYSYIDKNYVSIIRELESSCEKIPEISVAIKSADIDEIEYLVQKYPISALGENRVQQLLSRYDRLKGLNVPIHFIGSLQTNKVKYIIDKVDMICSLDRVELAREIDKQARKNGLVMDVLVEINSGREESKGGVLCENLEAFLDEISHFDAIKVRGFMTMGKKCEKNSEYLKYFYETYQLVLDILQKKRHNVYGLMLSMGMSDSFVPAAQAGATIVRIGRKMFDKN